MEPRLSFGSLSKWILGAAACLLPAMVCGQPEITKTFSTLPVTAAAADRRGDFYLAFDNGTLSKYDSTGVELINYSPKRLGTITLIDTWNPLKIFIFYKDYQSITILDRFLDPTIEYDLSGKSQGFIRLACPSQDNSFWLIDDSYNGLLKFDPIEQKVRSKLPFNEAVPTDGAVIFMREYQNILFLMLSNGEVVYFDNLGNYLGKISRIAAGQSFGFGTNQVHWAEENAFVAVNLYSGEVDSTSLPASYVQVIKAGNYLVGIKKEGGFDLLR